MVKQIKQKSTKEKVKIYLHMIPETTLFLCVCSFIYLHNIANAAHIFFLASGFFTFGNSDVLIQRCIIFY